VTRVEIGLRKQNLEDEFDNIDLSNLDNEHPLKLVDLDEILPEKYDVEDIVGLKHRNLFLMFFIKHLGSENSFFAKLDREILTDSFDQFFSFLQRHQEYIDMFQIVEDQRYLCIPSNSQSSNGLPGHFGQDHGVREFNQVESVPKGVHFQ
jgi:hypothetical protein